MTHHTALKIRTSQSHPLRIDELSCGAGTLGLTLCPGKQGSSDFGGTWERDLDVDLSAVLAWSPAAVVTLMEAHELERRAVSGLGARVEAAGVEWHHLPIRDCNAPDQHFERLWVWSGLRIRNLLKSGKRVLIHCRGGRGRTGLVAARLLVEFGQSPAAAIATVRKARQGAIEYSVQEAYVKGLTSSPIEDVRLDRIVGCLIGGAVGDGFGYAVEFLSLARIRERFGPDGLLEPVFDRGRLVASDDTQMTLFTAEGVMQAYGHAPGALIASVRDAYLRWYSTQAGAPGPTVAGLASLPEMRARRAPGNTCMSALANCRNDILEKASNNSKGCGGVMRVAPIGLATPYSPERARDLGNRAAALTHGHVCGWASAGVLAGLIARLRCGEKLKPAITACLEDSRDEEGEVQRHLEKATALANDPAISSVEGIRRLGLGWVGEEALAIALFAVLRGRGYREVIRLAANHDGDSDSTASIAGQIWGAAHGAAEIPNDWARRLDLLEPACMLAAELERLSRPVFEGDEPCAE